MTKKSTSLKTACNRSFLLLIAGLLLLAWGCAPVTPQRPGPPEAPPADYLIGKLTEENSRIKTFAGRGRGRFLTEDRHESLDLVLVAEIPDLIKIQFFDFIGRPALTLVANRTGLFALNHRENIFYKGRAGTGSLKGFLPVTMPLNELIPLTMGLVHLRDYRQAVASSDPNEALWRVELFGESGASVERLWIDRTGLQAVKMESGPLGQPDFAVSFSDFVTAEGEPSLPGKINLKNLKDAGACIIEYDEIRINPDLPDHFFQLQAPKGSKTEIIPDN